MIGASKLLPLLIIVVVLSFSVRITEVVTGVSNISNTAFAGEKKSKDKEKDKSDEKPEHHDNSKKDAEDIEDVDGAEIVKGVASKAPKWRDASDADTDVTGIKFELFKDLSKRRDSLDKQEKDLNIREALLQATQKELTLKYQELTKLRIEIEALLKTQSDEENKRINSLVKIYEGMKPKDAARIFDTLDLDVLLSVISKMSERKVSPVLAAMNPERVRTITIMLAEQKTLPTLR